MSLLESLLFSFVFGMSNSIGHAVYGVSEVGHAADIKIGTFGVAREDILPSYYSPEQVEFLQRLSPALMGLEGNTITSLGDFIITPSRQRK